jgi:hypothetical protein
MNDVAEVLPPVRISRHIPRRDQRCSNCEFSRRIEKMATEAYDCRRYPPTIVAVVKPNPLSGQPMMGIEAHFPGMKPHGWCGEWQPETKGDFQ